MSIIAASKGASLVKDGYHGVAALYEPIAIA
jgi:hypothetical protein